MNRRLLAAITAMSFAVAMLQQSAAAQPPVPAGSGTHLSSTRLTPQIVDTLRALDRLHHYGYTWTTDSGARKAILHWQKANGLVVDGIVGPQTLRSLGLDGPSDAAGPGSIPPARPAAPSTGDGGALPASPSSGRTPVSPATPAADRGTVEQIIRDIWPDDTEDQAVRIATRESNLTPTAHNSCCYGLFQLHFRAHRAWLANLGVTTPADLYDPAVNTRAALALFQAEGGWSPAWDL